MDDDPAAQSGAAALPTLLSERFPRSRPETQLVLRASATVRTFRAGETVLVQGEESLIAMVLDGQVALGRSTPHGRQVIVRIASRGDLCPMLPLATLPAAVDVVALTQTRVAIWRANDVRALVASDPGLAVAILDQALAALDEATGRLEDLLSQGALQRVARILRRYADLFFAETPVLTRRQLPMFVGTSREMTGRVLRTLEARGLVARVGRNGLRLIDPVGIATLADGRDERRRSAPRGRARPGSS